MTTEPTTKEAYSPATPRMGRSLFLFSILKRLGVPVFATSLGLVALIIFLVPSYTSEQTYLLVFSGICFLAVFTNYVYQVLNDLQELQDQKLNEERYVLAVENAGIALWDWDITTGSIVWGGKAWKIFGVDANADVPRDEKQVRARIPAEDNEAIDKIIFGALENGDSFTAEFRLRQQNGRMIWVQSRGKITDRKDNRPARAIGIFMDVTELKQAESTVQSYQSKLETIVENIVDGLITIDDQGIVQSYNKACERIFGYRPTEAIGKNVKMLMPAPYAEQHDQYLKNYKETGKAKIIGIGREVEGRRKDGSVFPLDLSIAEVKLSGQRLFSGIVRDITERRKDEDQLRRTKEELEQFAYIASHDLKAPLRGIDNLATWIAEDLSDVLTDDTREKMGLLRGRVARLEMLLEDILQYSRAGRVVDTPVTLNTGDLVRQIIEDGGLPAGFNVEISDDMPTVITPQTPLRQVFTNLIVNAGKHHDKESGSIKIGVSDFGGFYEFSVADDGPGIPPEFHERVFRMFQTLKPRDVKESSGLGLAIVKKLVEWQGGKVWIESKAGMRGTTFRFLWPKRWVTEEKRKYAA